MKFLQTLIQKIVGFFKSGKAEAALNQAAELVPLALPIVQEIATMAPNKTDQEMLSVFQKYAVPGAQQYLSTPVAQRGYVLLQIATQVLSQEVPGVATNILNAAVQLAVTGSKT